MKRYLFLTLFAAILLIGLVVYQYLTFHDGKLHVVFCNVGQGDAILIVTPNKKHIMVDTGPDASVVACLARHMPFWERTIDLAILTHPHSDHFMGLYHMLDRYSVLSFSTEKLDSKALSFQEVKRELHAKNIPQHVVSAGDRFSIGDVSLTIAAPTKEFLQQTSPDGMIGESREFASVITHLSYGSFDLLLTGDSQAGELTDAANRIASSIDVLQSPHHGSATGLDMPVLALLQPKLVVISVGKNNYGHPSPKTLTLLKEQGITVLRTDKQGDVELVSDGERWRVR